jgi:hypothetical protein
MGAFHPDAAGLLAADMTTAPALRFCFPESAVPMGMTAIFLHGRLRCATLRMNLRGSTAALRSFCQHGCTVFPVKDLRLTGAENLVLRCYIIAVTMNMVAVCWLHSRSIDTPRSLMIVNTFHNLFGQTGFTAGYMSAGRTFHFFHIPTLTIMGMMGAGSLFSQSRHRYIRHHHAQGQQNRQHLFHLLHKYFLLHRIRKKAQPSKFTE